MAIKMRRGLFADLDRSKLVAGEIVMSTDTGFVGIAKAPNDVMELAKKDDIPDEVIANPSGTATDDLTKIQIGNTVYGIEGGSGEVVEMTYAEYRALTPEQKMDGTVRYISDYPSGGGGGGAGYTKELVYDSGSWSTYAPYNTDVSFTKSIAEFDQLLFLVASPDDDPTSTKLSRSALIIDINSVSEWGYFTFYQSRTLRLVNITNTTFNYYSDVNVAYDRGKQLGIYKIYGIKFGGGSLPDYSTTEQRTGQKWIDGKPVYQKTMVFDDISGRITYSSGVLNLDIETVVEFFAWVKLGSQGGSQWITSPFIENNAYRCDCHYQSQDDKIYVNSNWGATNAIVTFKYTKTTDTSA